MGTEKNIPIMLVNQASSGLFQKSKELLDRLGYTDIQMMGWDDLLCSNADQCMKVLVIPFENKIILSETHKSSLERIRKRPVLGVIPAHQRAYNLFLTYCNDFLCWPCSGNEFSLRLERLFKKFRMNPTPARDAKPVEALVDLNMVGTSRPFLHALQRIKKIAHNDATVLIEGETGTGKEMAARAIHYMGARRECPFIPVNCGAIPDSLLENELFGHEKGAFTDAKNTQMGLVEQADRGTIFFDEVDTFSPKGQFVLLRFLEDLIFKPLGGGRLKKADVRIMAASNTKLSEMVSQGRFRRDLFYRLDIMSVELPPLCQRTGDIELMAEYFLAIYKKRYNQPGKKFSPDMISWMKGYGWPGNIRELENLIHREFLLSDGPIIKLDQKIIQPKDRRINGPDRRQNLIFDYSLSEAKKKVIDSFEKKYLTRLIREVDGNVTRAAKLAGKERRTLGKLLKKHNIIKNGIIPPL